MLLAVNNGVKYYADEPGFESITCQCPVCGGNVIRVLGDVYVKHWRHERDSSCDYGSGETMWHLYMKSLFDKSCVEVIHDGVRSDVMLPGGTAVEFQLSAIEPMDVVKRTGASMRIVWLFNLVEQYDRGQITLKKDYYEYRKPKSIFANCLPNLFWYCTKDTIVEPEGFSREFVVNEKTGYKDLWYSGNAWIRTIDEFVAFVIKYDDKFKT